MLAQGIRVQGAWWSPRVERAGSDAARLAAPNRRGVAAHGGRSDAEERKVREQLEETAPANCPAGSGHSHGDAQQRDPRLESLQEPATSGQLYGPLPRYQPEWERTHYRSVNRHGNPAIRHALIELVWAVWPSGSRSILRAMSVEKSCRHD